MDNPSIEDLEAQLASLTLMAEPLWEQLTDIESRRDNIRKQIVEAQQVAQSTQEYEAYYRGDAPAFVGMQMRVKSGYNAHVRRTIHYILDGDIVTVEGMTEYGATVSVIGKEERVPQDHSYVPFEFLEPVQWVIWPADKPYFSGSGIDGDIYDTFDEAKAGMFATHRQIGFNAIPYIAIKTHV